MIKHEDFGKRFALHASRMIDESTYGSIARIAPELQRHPDERGTPWYALSRITSAVIAVATLRDALYIGGCSPETTQQALTSLGIAGQERFTFGPTVYVLDDIHTLVTPVACRGWLGFWKMPEDLITQVEDQLQRTA